MQKSFDEMDGYELFFEDIGPKSDKQLAPDEQVRKQNAYEKTPCLSEEQVLKLSEDLNSIPADKNLPPHKK